ncbi:MAG TPA: hypothetical protein VJ739_10595 [Gemmataceae bacterium]|nr:hypothetical protein [Gemmataceae bacterium]
MGKGLCDGQSQGNGLGSGKFPGTKRPETKDADFRAQDKQERVQFDPKGRKEIVNFVEGRTFKKKPSAEVAGDVKEASQEAPEALESQHVPRAASDMTKGYYEGLQRGAK